MSLNDYIDVDDVALREHIMETNGACDELDNFSRAIMLIIKEQADAADLPHLFDNYAGLDGFMAANIPDDLTETQAAHISTIRLRLIPAIGAARKQHELWQRDLTARVLDAYPILEGVDEWTVSSAILPNQSHVIRIYPGAPEEAEAHLNEYLALVKAAKPAGEEHRYDA